MIDYTQILTRKFNAQWSLNGDTYEGLTWLDQTPKPSQQQLDDLWDEVKAEIEAEQGKLATAKEAAHAKLAALGLTFDDLKALGL